MTLFTVTMFVIAAVLFLLYWIIGGVIFATIAVTQVIKLKKTRFSVLFTMLSVVCALAASRTGLFLAQDSVQPCLAEAGDRLERFSAILACGILEITLAGTIWFIALIGFGLLLLLLSRAENQSWIDSDFGLKEESDVREW